MHDRRDAPRGYGDEYPEEDDWRPRTRSGGSSGNSRGGGGGARRQDSGSRSGPGRRQASRRRKASGRAGTSKRARKHRTLKIVGGVLAVLVLVTAGLGTYLYEHLFDNVATVSLANLKNRPPASKPNAQGQTPQNILVLGSQTRDGQTGVNLGNSTKLGTDLSDTAMLFHLSADRKWAVVVSVPRDLVVARPQCTSRFNPSVTVPDRKSVV